MIHRGIGHGPWDGTFPPLGFKWSEEGQGLLGHLLVIWLLAAGLSGCTARIPDGESESPPCFKEKEDCT